MARFRRASGLIAASLIAVLGAALALSGVPALGIAFFVLGIGLVVWQAYRLFRTRPTTTDPYDLSRLWELDPDDPVFEESLEREAQVRAELNELSGALFCPNCGHAVPDLFVHCPECGQRLR